MRHLKCFVVGLLAQGDKCSLCGRSDGGNLCTAPCSRWRGERDGHVSAATSRTRNRARHSHDTVCTQEWTDKITRPLPLFSHLSRQGNATSCELSWCGAVDHPRLKVLVYTLNQALQHKLPPCWRLTVSNCGNVLKNMDWYEVEVEPRRF